MMLINTKFIQQLGTRFAYLKLMKVLALLMGPNGIKRLWAYFCGLQPSKKDSLWLQWVHSFYIKSKNFWTDPMKGDYSWYWKKLLKLCYALSIDSIQSCNVNELFSLKKCYFILMEPINKFPLSISMFGAPWHSQSTGFYSGQPRNRSC